MVKKNKTVNSERDEKIIIETEAVNTADTEDMDDMQGAGGGDVTDIPGTSGVSGPKEQNEDEDSIIAGGKTPDDTDLLKEQLSKKENELKVHVELIQRVKAEFDNYKRRTAKEKEQLYTDITGDVIAKLLPVVDNLERAVNSASETTDMEKLLDGVKMILNQFKDVLAKEGVEEIPAMDQQFDPNYHNAVMHVEDDGYEDNMVVEEFQKGYKIKDKVLRYSMVKVAN